MKTIYAIPFLILLAAFGHSIITLKADAIPVKLIKTDNGIKDIWAGYKQLERICSCESHGDPNQIPRQFKDGEVLRGTPNRNDIGECQINQPTWGTTAKKLGYDIWTEEGNVKMAKWIYDNDPRHAKNWSWSESCWK